MLDKRRLDEHCRGGVLEGLLYHEPGKASAIKQRQERDLAALCVATVPGVKGSDRACGVGVHAPAVLRAASDESPIHVVYDALVEPDSYAEACYTLRAASPGEGRTAVFP